MRLERVFRIGQGRQFESHGDHPGLGWRKLGWRNVRSQSAFQRSEGLSPVAAIVRRHDRDRFQTALFAPAARREALFALYAFNYEIARVRESVTQPMLGHIRLEWWRENIAAAFDGGPRPPSSGGRGARRGDPRARADARPFRPADRRARGRSRRRRRRRAWRRSKTMPRRPRRELVLLALEALGAEDPAAVEAGRHIGIAYALAGLLRGAADARRAPGRSIIPRDCRVAPGSIPRNGVPAVTARRCGRCRRNRRCGAASSAGGARTAAASRCRARHSPPCCRRWSPTIR